MNPSEQAESSKNLNENLLSNAMRRNWRDVVKIYKQDKAAHKAEITGSGETALHIAISDEEEGVVEELVSIVDPLALAIQNDRGNTPLHLAAYVGCARMCRCIASRDPKLMAIRNEGDETPIFLAVVHGRKEAFLCIHALCAKENESYMNYRRKDGSTILHAAIAGEHFDLAFQIIHLYPRLQDFVDEQGSTPLHLLASKPSAFRSGSEMDVLQKLIYYYVHVDKLKCLENSGTSVSLPHRPRIITRAAAAQIDPENQNATVPKNHSTCFHALKIFAKTIKAMVLLVSGSPIETQKLRKEKEKHTWSLQIMEELLMNSPIHLYRPSSKYRRRSSLSYEPVQIGENEYLPKELQSDMKESTFLVAAKNGILEMVVRILESFPAAIHDENIDGKNIVLLAAENRRPQVYQFLLKLKKFKDTIFEKTDKDGNNALHLASMKSDHQPLGLPGPAFKMQWEMKWYEFVKNSMPLNFFERRNMKGQTPSELFIANHKELVEDASKWLKDTSQSCSVVATLIATVAFATSTSIPGGLKQEGGIPALGNEPAFCIFGIASLVALAISISSIMLFLSFYSSSYDEISFIFALPAKLLLAMMSLSISLVSMLVSFCAAHFLIIKDQLKYSALPLYTLIFILVTLYSFVHCPWFFHAALNAFNRVPERSAKRQLR